MFILSQRDFKIIAILLCVLLLFSFVLVKPIEAHAAVPLVGSISALGPMLASPQGLLFVALIAAGAVFVNRESIVPIVEGVWENLEEPIQTFLMASNTTVGRVLTLTQALIEAVQIAYSAFMGSNSFDDTFISDLEDKKLYYSTLIGSSPVLVYDNIATPYEDRSTISLHTDWKDLIPYIEFVPITFGDFYHLYGNAFIYLKEISEGYSRPYFAQIVDGEIISEKSINIASPVYNKHCNDYPLYLAITMTAGTVLIDFHFTTFRANASGDYYSAYHDWFSTGSLTESFRDELMGTLYPDMVNEVNGIPTLGLWNPPTETLDSPVDVNVGDIDASDVLNIDRTRVLNNDIPGVNNPPLNPPLDGVGILESIRALLLNLATVGEFNPGEIINDAIDGIRNKFPTNLFENTKNAIASLSQGNEPPVIMINLNEIASKTTNIGAGFDNEFKDEYLKVIDFSLLENEDMKFFNMTLIQLLRAVLSMVMVFNTLGFVRRKIYPDKVM
jgi:hypothetical protein